MSALAARSPGADAALARDLIAHLDTQLEAVRRLLGIVLEQGAAIRRRDVHSVVRLAGMLQAEMAWRAVLDEERRALLERAGAHLGVAAGEVTLTRLCAVMEAGEAAGARARSGELRGLLAEVQHEHRLNRVLMQQELAFLDLLLGLTGTGGGYGVGGAREPARGQADLSRRRVLDLEV